MSYWYWYRQTNPKPAGSWVVAGPYATKEAAMSDRETGKRDGQVGVPFLADSKEEAETKIVFQ